MDTFKLDSKFKPVSPERNCGNCGFKAEERMPQQIASSLVCHVAPPQVVIVPSGNGAVQAMTMFPVVQPQQFCYMHRYARELEGAIGNTTEVTQIGAGE